jgi:hypothetical protein
VDWAELQVKTTANFCSRSLFWNFVSGGLSNQIEHHLFPSTCHVHYPAIAPIVKKTCEEFGIKYVSPLRPCGDDIDDDGVFLNSCCNKAPACLSALSGNPALLSPDITISQRFRQRWLRTSSMSMLMAVMMMMMPADDSGDAFCSSPYLCF